MGVHSCSLFVRVSRGTGFELADRKSRAGGEESRSMEKVGGKGCQVGSIRRVQE